MSRRTNVKLIDTCISTIIFVGMSPVPVLMKGSWFPNALQNYFSLSLLFSFCLHLIFLAIEF